MPIFTPDSSFFPKRTLQESSPFGGVLSDAIAKRLAMAKAQSAEGEAKYAERKALSDAVYQELKNKNQEEINKYYPQDIKSQIGLRGAQTGYYGEESNKLRTMTPLEAEQQRIKNKYLPQMEEADINYKNIGGGRGGVGSKEEMFFQSLVSKDNPVLRNDPDKVYQASNILKQGGTQMPDGTPIHLSPSANESLDRITKYGTTSPLITQRVQSNQAEAEMPIVKKYIDEGIKPYGTTIFGTSPQQVKDTLNIHDKKAQERLGNYMAAQQLLYDRAALSLKINALPAGVRLADEVKKLSYSTINEHFPMMPAEARQIASDRVAKALKEMLNARRSVKIGASSISGNKQNIGSINENDPLGIL